MHNVKKQKQNRNVKCTTTCTICHEWSWMERQARWPIAGWHEHQKSRAKPKPKSSFKQSPPHGQERNASSRPRSTLLSRWSTRLVQLVEPPLHWKRAGRKQRQAARDVNRAGSCEFKPRPLDWFKSLTLHLVLTVDRHALHSFSAAVLSLPGWGGGDKVLRQKDRVLRVS